MSLDEYVKILFRTSMEKGYMTKKKYPHTTEFKISITENIKNRIIEKSCSESKLLTIEGDEVLFFFNNTLAKIFKYYKKNTIILVIEKKKYS